jgi:hypothetical protein
MTSTKLHWLISPTLPIRQVSKLIDYGGISARNRNTMAWASWTAGPERQLSVSVDGSSQAVKARAATKLPCARNYLKDLVSIVVVEVNESRRIDERH